MSLRLRNHESVRAAVRRVGRERITAASGLIGRQLEGASGEVIHQARKQLKRVRALFRLIRPNIGHRRWARANGRLRDVSIALSAVRDATVLIHTLEELRVPPERRSDLLTALAAAARARLVKAQGTALADRKDRDRLQKRLRETARLIGGWTSIHRGWKAVGPGLKMVYAEARAAAEPLRHLAECNDMRLHEARKRAQTLLHVLEFLEAVRPRHLKAQARALHELADLLGKDHDLAVLAARLHDMTPVRAAPADLTQLNRTIRARRTALQRQAAHLAARIYAATAEEFAGQIHGDWKSWRSGARHGK